MTRRRIIKILIKTAYVLTGGLFLLSFALFNQFPLLYPDTGTYIESAYELYVPPDRLVTYGLWLRLVCQDWNLWWAVFWPAVVLSWLLFEWGSKLFFVSRTVVLMAIITLSFFTGVSLPVGQLIPDVFSPILIMAIIHLFFISDSKMEWILCGLLISICMSLHMSNIVLGFLLCVGLVIYRWSQLKGYFKGVIIISLLLGALIGPCIQWVMADEFFYVRSSHLFHMSRVVQDGSLEAYLEQSCVEGDNMLCMYKDSIPIDFLWNQEKSPLYRLGGWNANSDYYKQVLWDIHLQPRYLFGYNVPYIFVNGWKQLFNFGVFDVHPANGERVPSIIARYFPHQYKELKNGYQETDSSRVYQYAERLDQRQGWMIPFLLILTLLLWKSMTPRVKTVFCIIAIAILVNAFITGGLSTIVPRYQNRVMWLLVVPALLLGIHELQAMVKRHTMTNEIK